MNGYHRAAVAVLTAGAIAVPFIAVAESGPGEPLGRTGTPTGVVVTATATETATMTATETATVTATETAAPPPTSAPVIVATPAGSPTGTPTPVPTAAPSPTSRNHANGLTDWCLVQLHQLIKKPC